MDDTVTAPFQSQVPSPKYRPELVLQRLASGDISPEDVPLDDAGTDDDVSKVKEKLGRNSQQYAP